jgi:hypothetical protein
MESISLPMVALAAAAAAVLMYYPTPSRTLAKKSAGVCQSRYCGPRDMFVDTPKNTQLKDQSLGVGLQRPKTLPGPATVFKKIESDLQREQLLNPGVILVAHAVA